MEKLSYIPREKLHSRFYDNLRAIFIGLLLGNSSFLMVIDYFNIDYRADNMFGGSMKGGFIKTVNAIGELLCENNNSLYPQYEGEGRENSLFLTLVLLLFLIIGILIIKSNFRPLLLIYLIISVIPVVCWNLNCEMGVLIFLYISIGLAYIFMKNRIGTNVILMYVVLLLLIIQLCFMPFKGGYLGFEKECQASIKNSMYSLYYGEKLLGEGEISQRERIKSDENALELTMKIPTSIYLRGYVGENFDGYSWKNLSGTVRYDNKNLMYWLNKENFNTLGQLQVANDLFGKSKAWNSINVKNIGADSHYAYVPYEIRNKGISKADNVAGSYVISDGLNRLTEYDYEMSPASLTQDWTRIMCQVYASESDEVRNYLKCESNYNDYVYKNFTAITKNDEKLLKEYVGKNGDQRKGHINYKTAIKKIKSYLNDNYIYTENLGENAEDGSALEIFLKEKRGYDIHYATLATELFRYYGIPARYVEGYLVTPADVKGKNSDDTINISQKNLHAWTEIYIDGTGFVPIEVCPSWQNIMKEDDLSRGFESEDIDTEFKAQSQSNIVNSNMIAKAETLDESSPIAEIVYKILILLTILIGLIIFIRFFIRKIFPIIKQNRRLHKLFYETSPKTAISSIYGYIVASGYEVTEQVRELGNRASYSSEEMKEEERKWILDYLKSQRKR